MSKEANFQPYTQQATLNIIDRSSNGVCYGLCLEYARYINAKLAKGKAIHDINFINKLTATSQIHSILTQSLAKATTFNNRVKSYHELQIPCEENKMLDDLTFKKTGLLAQLPAEQIAATNNIGITFINPLVISGHIVAINFIRDTDIITGYRLFDPNYGEWRFTSKSPEKNKKAFEQIVQQLYELYAHQNNYLNISWVDLDNKLKEVRLFTTDKTQKVSKELSREQLQVNSSNKNKKNPQDFLNNFARSTMESTRATILQGLVASFVSKIPFVSSHTKFIADNLIRDYSRPKQNYPNKDLIYCVNPFNGEFIIKNKNQILDQKSFDRLWHKIEHDVLLSLHVSSKNQNQRLAHLFQYFYGDQVDAPTVTVNSRRFNDLANDLIWLEAVVADFKEEPWDSKKRQMIELVINSKVKINDLPSNFLDINGKEDAVTGKQPGVTSPKNTPLYSSLTRQDNLPILKAVAGKPNLSDAYQKYQTWRESYKTSDQAESASGAGDRSPKKPSGRRNSY